ncbi:N-acetyltransferase [Spirochaetia bacterium]|nr:N-acetyltransferase [Spirochaetia bacterium]
MINLYTERLLIRDHILDDLNTHHELLSDEVSMRYLPDIKTKNIKESEQNLMKAIEDAKLKNRTFYFFRIENKLTKEFIGEIGYTVSQDTPFGKLVDMGYFIKEKYWNQGYTTEALKKVMEYAFKEDNVYRISTGCIKENIGSENVMKKCGMIKEGEFKEYALHEGKLKDRVTYRLLRKEWNNN